jgi:uncharacterized membrane protein YqiK
MVIVPEDKIGLVVKKWVLIGKERSLPEGRIVALNGEAGYQADCLAPGLYWGFWIWQYDVNFTLFTDIPKGKLGLISAKDGNQLPVGAILGRHVDCNDFSDARKFLTNGGQRGRQLAFLNSGKYRINTMLFDVFTCDITAIEDGCVGIITTLDGTPLETGAIAGSVIEGHNNFQDFDIFIKNGGQRGLQTQVIQAGSYSLNPWAVQLEKKTMTEIPIGYVGVVNSFVGEPGEDVTGESFKHGNIVKKGQKGICIETLDPGKYPINTYTHRVEVVPTTNIVLNWADARNESHELDKNLNTISVRSKDGFTFNLDVSQIIHVPATEAPKVIARFGSMPNLVSQVLEPTIGNYFRNSAQDSDVIDFLNSRQERQNAAKVKIAAVLDEYNVKAVDTLIGDIVPPAPLMKTLTDRKIAQEEKITFDTQKLAQDTRKNLESSKALADMQAQVVEAGQNVEISQRRAESVIKATEGEAQSTLLRAEANAKATKLNADADSYKTEITGKADASKIEAIGIATAESYDRQVKAMGEDNFAKLKVIEEIGKNNVQIIPKVWVSGGSDGNANPINGLLGMRLLDDINKEDEKEVTKKSEKKLIKKDEEVK